VDEESETRPITEAGQIALEAEHVLREHREFQSVILRLTGLYGPDRLLRRVDQLRSGEPIAGNGNAWLNLIHVDDAAGAVLSAADRLMRGVLKPKTYLVSDDRPVRRCEYFEQLAQLTGTVPPRFDPSAPSRITGVGKRCRNHAAKRELGLSLAFPTYADGLEDAWTRSTQQT
jgi:nucleoside-diphosphate-sugar epimerase